MKICLFFFYFNKFSNSFYNSRKHGNIFCEINDKNKVNKLNVASLPDDKFRDSQLAEIKPGGTVSNAVSYELTDDTTPVNLIAESFGTEFGSKEFSIK